MIAENKDVANVKDEAIEEYPDWVIVQRPGMIPLRKGPFRDAEHIKSMLLAMYAQYPDCMCVVINMPHDSYPESGREWLDIYALNN